MDEAREVAPLSIWEDESAVYIEVDVPGVSLADLDVSVEKGKLVICGERKAKRQPTNCRYNEIYFGRFQRTVAMDETIDPKSIVARLDGGVLSLKLNKSLAARAQRVEIRRGRPYTQTNPIELRNVP